MKSRAMRAVLATSFCVGWLVVPVATTFAAEGEGEGEGIRYRSTMSAFGRQPFPPDHLKDAATYRAQLAKRKTFAAIGLGLLGDESAIPELRSLVRGGLRDAHAFEACTGLVLLGESDCLHDLMTALAVDLPEYASWVERGSWSGNVVSYAADALRFLSDNGVTLPVNALEGLAARLDHPDPGIRETADVVLSHQTGVRLAIRSDVPCRDSLLPNPCDLLHPQAWLNWFAENRTRHETGQPYISHGLELILGWEEQGLLKATFVNHSASPQTLDLVEGVAHRVEPLGAMADDPRLRLRSASGVSSWRLTGGGAHWSSKSATGTWQAVTLAPFGSASFPVVPIFTQDPDLGEDDGIVLLYEDRRCAEARWCGVLVSNPVAAFPGSR